jgi:hypothetical protein
LPLSENASFDVVAPAGFTKIATRPAAAPSERVRQRLLAAFAAYLQPAPTFLLDQSDPGSACICWIFTGDHTFVPLRRCLPVLLHLQRDLQQNLPAPPNRPSHSEQVGTN